MKQDGRKYGPADYIGCIDTVLFIWQLSIWIILRFKKSLISVAGNTTLLSYISPAICIGVFGASFYTPLLMDALEYESDEDYAFYARCRGLSEKKTLLCHFLPRAAIGLVPNFYRALGWHLPTQQ